MKKPQLSFKERMWAVFAYVILLVGALRYLAESFSPLVTEGTSFSYVLVSGGLLLIFGVYIAEPYFTKPTDVLVNSTGIILFLLGVSAETEYIGKNFILSVAFVTLGASVFVLLANEWKRGQKIVDVAVDLLVKIGQSRIAFSVIYLATVATYFGTDKVAFSILVTFWAIFMSGFIVENTVRFVFEKWTEFKSENDYVGRVSGMENRKIYRVERDLRSKALAVQAGDILVFGSGESKKYGITIRKALMIDKEIITIFLIDSLNKGIDNVGSYLASEVRKVEEGRLSSEQQELIQKEYLYKNYTRVVGYVHPESDVQKIKFRVFDSQNDGNISDGSIVASQIRGKTVLYQVFNAVTQDEDLDRKDKDTFFLAVARKLGVFKKENREIENVKWLPEMFSPVYILEDSKEPKTETDIGELPGTDYPIRIDNYDEMVTHNTAILGILGVGKSCLTFELLQKILKNTDARVICLDITNEYKRELVKYINSDCIVSDDENAFNTINANFEYIHQDRTADGKSVANFEKSGNTAQYRKAVHDDLMQFFFESDELPEEKKICGDKFVRIFNPDYHKASRGEKVGFNVITTELSQAEKTRIICEETFKILMKLQLDEEKKSKVLVVFEEAHSLVPEWNSAANEGDKTAANGTARVILQGRKYGLGSLVITQRTANISKTILNQCNSIFALKVFDDTGKQFLENYVGSDYANMLSSLDDRHAVITGKAFKLKQPVIIKLNDRKDIILK